MFLSFRCFCRVTFSFQTVTMLVSCNNVVVARRHGDRTVQVISRHKQLQTQLRRDVHILDVLCVPMLLVVVEVFANFFQHEATISDLRQALATTMLDRERT